MGQENNFLLEQPEKIKTLAGKREERTRKLNHFRERISGLSPQWWVGIGEVVGILGIFLINLYLLLRFFGQPDQTNVFSAPLIPVLTLLTDHLVSSTYGVRIWILVSFLFFPVTFYFFVKEVSGRKLAGLLSALIVSLPRGLFLGQRVEMGLLGSDGAHMASLVFMPLVCLMLFRFLRFGGFWPATLSALGTAMVALTSPIGLFVLMVFMVVIAFSEMLLGKGRIKLLRLLVVFLGAVGFSAFWYNPKFTLLIIKSSQGQTIVQALFNLLPVSFFLVPLLGVFGFLIFENRTKLQSLFVATFLVIGFGALSWGSGISISLAAPSRFLPALGMAASFLLGVVFVQFFDFLHHSPILDSPKLAHFKILTRKRELASLVAMGVVVAGLLLTMGIWGRSLEEIEGRRVLGAKTVKKVGFWEIKEKTSMLENVFGYTITTMTTVGAALVKSKLGR